MVKIGLVQINNSFSGQNYLPYSTACLESYFRQYGERAEDFEFIEHIYKRNPIHVTVSKLEDADVVGFSTYVWNAQISLEIARRLKRSNPNRLIMFGGPHVPDKPEDFLNSNPFIDIVIHNEGERTFTNILNHYPSKKFSEQTGVSYLDESGDCITTPPTPRMRDLSELPSPFLSGVLDRIIRANPDEKWIGLWETNRGCPFKCTFCDWGSATAAKVVKFDDFRLEKELAWMARKKIEYIFVCDANFGIQKRDVEIAKAVAQIKKKTGYPQGFSVQNTKNATERAYQTQKIIADAGLNKGVALSMQSLDPTTLANIKRENISLESYLELARRFTEDKVETYSDLILPLPGETYTSFCKGVDDLIRAGQHNRIQFNNLSILPNAEMGDVAYLKKFGMKTIESEIINIHGTKENKEDDVPEYQELVIETDSMSAEDWRNARCFSWMSAFLHFNKILQIPIMLALRFSNAEFSDIVKSFLAAKAEDFPLTNRISQLFNEEAISISEGGPEYKFSEEWLSIYWPADEYAYIWLVHEQQVEKFYAEAKCILHDALKNNSLAIDMKFINEAVDLNKSLLCQPYFDDVIECEMSADIYKFWQEARQSKQVALTGGKNTLAIDRSNRHYEHFNDWCREIVWWGNKKGAYLYSTSAIQEQLSGHY